MNKYFLMVAAVILSGHCEAMEISFSEVVKKNAESKVACADAKDGAVCRMTQKSAADYCRLQGAVLVTTRMFAQWSITRGAKGMLTVEFVDRELKGKAPKNYYLVKSINDGVRDDFYFNHEGFQRPVGEMGDNDFWTSSIVPENKNYAHVFYGAIGGGGGKPEEHHVNYRYAVICAKGSE